MPNLALLAFLVGFPLFTGGIWLVPELVALRREARAAAERKAQLCKG